MSRLRKRLRPLGRFLRKVCSWRRNLLLDFDLALPIPERRMAAPVIFREATSDDLARLLEDPDHEVHRHAAQLYAEMHEAGDPVFVGVLGGRIVYRALASMMRWRIAGRRHLSLGRHKAVILGCFTVEDLRGKGIYPAALTTQLRALKERGVSRVFINVEEANVASLRGIEKAGFRRLGWYEVLRLAGRAWLFIEPELRRAIETDHPD